MRILVTSTPGTGHIHPMLPLVVDLHSRGHRVLWATGPASCHLVEAFGITPRRPGRISSTATHGSHRRPNTSETSHRGNAAARRCR
jgi:UDP:flavonoid glycosyltransferase YjiC (YdhE family)